MAIPPQTLRSPARSPVRSLASLLIGSLCSIGGLPAAPAHAAEPVTYLLPAAPNQPAFAPWLIARQLGYYTDAGYDIHFATAKGGTEVAQQIAIGQAAVGGAIGDTPIFMRNYGVHVKTIATLGGGSLTVIVAGQDRGIHALQDLRGKRVAVLSRTDSSYHVLLGALASAGLSPHDVTIDTAAPKVIVRRVINGSSDACACIPDWEVQIMHAQPAAVSLPTAGAFPSMAQAILASDRSITGQPAMLKAIVAATLHGMRFIMDDQRKAADVFVQAVPARKGQEDLIAGILRAYVDHAYSGQAIAGETDPKRLEGLQRFYLSQHLVRNEVPVNELYTNEFIPPEE
jgi:NitT/TauT family transport system substrate-binding protein